MHTAMLKDNDADMPSSFHGQNIDVVAFRWFKRPAQKKDRWDRGEQPPEI
jgi:hypothetical protein